MRTQKRDHMDQSAVEKIEDQFECLTTAGLAKLFKTSPNTIHRMCLKGIGPPWFDLQEGIGERVIRRFRKDLALKWTEQNSITKDQKCQDG